MWSGETSAAIAQDRIRISVVETAILVWLADELSLFDKTGLSIELVPTGSGSSAARAVAMGDAELGTSSEFAFVSVALENPQMRLLSSISKSSTVDIFARRASGIESYAGLAGRRVAAPPSTFAKFILEGIILKQGIAADDVIRADLSPSEIIEALAEGTLDAAAVWEPHIQTARDHLGAEFVLLPHLESFDYYFLLSSNAEWLDQHPEATAKIISAPGAALDFAIREPEAAKAALGRRLGLDAAFVSSIWPRHRLDLRLSQDLLRLMEDEAWFRIDAGLSRGPAPNFLTTIAHGELAKARPGAVTMIGINPVQASISERK